MPNEAKSDEANERDTQSGNASTVIEMIGMQFDGASKIAFMFLNEFLMPYPFGRLPRSCR